MLLVPYMWASMTFLPYMWASMTFWPYSALILLGTRRYFGPSGLMYFHKYGREPGPNP